MTESNASDWQFRIIISHEEQYSILPTGRERRRSWKRAGVEGPEVDDRTSLKGRRSCLCPAARFA